ncbi:unnamed protein product [Leptidea sinapis]|uniref:Endonuclease/exonuclease/phosphatase domain-containing protein n=1 Tax=Leptidea sinapis TaxID=189913 RepID=A0A5E4PYP1_9NEOP|nr:unnamed protein product [Leptidea sinapis]
MNKYFDVLCITEHNMILDDVSFLSIPNFQLASFCLRTSRHGASCILIRKGHKFRVISDIDEYSILNIKECSAVELVDHKIIIICVYRSPKITVTAIDLFFSSLHKILNKICFKNRKVILCGDFNIDRMKTNRTSVYFEQLLQSYNLKLLFKEPTRLSSNTCIDNFAHNIRGCTSSVYELAISDHTAQVVQVPTKRSILLSHWYIHKRQFSIENMNKYYDCLKSLSFQEVYSVDDPNLAYNIFLDLILLFYNLCFTIVKIKISSTKRHRWLSRGIRTCSKIKRKLLWKSRLTKCKSDIIKLKAYSKRLKSIIKLTQRSQNNYIIKNSSNKTKATWNIINGTLNNISRNDIDAIRIGSKIVTDPQMIAQAFNDFFIDEINNDCKKSGYNDNPKYITRHHQPNSLFFNPTCCYDILDAIKSLKNTNSNGYDVAGFVTCFLLYNRELPKATNVSHESIVCKTCSIVDRSKVRFVGNENITVDIAVAV